MVSSLPQHKPENGRSERVRTREGNMAGRRSEQEHMYNLLCHLTVASCLLCAGKNRRSSTKPYSTYLRRGNCPLLITSRGPTCLYIWLVDNWILTAYTRHPSKTFTSSADIIRLEHCLPFIFSSSFSSAGPQEAE